jgi:hypothetical protein
MNNQTPEHVFVRVCEGLRPNMLLPRQDEFTNGMNAIVSDCLLADSFARPSFSTIGVSMQTVGYVLVLNIL